MDHQPALHAFSAPTNQAAYHLLLRLIDRTGLRRRSFLARLAAIDERFAYSDAALTNWGRPGRAFPHKSGLLYAIISVLVDHPPACRCTAAEAVDLGLLAAMPLSEIELIADLFAPGALRNALIEQLAVCDGSSPHQGGRARWV